MVNIAIDIETGEEVPAKKARFGHKYGCKCCRSPLLPVKHVPNPFYRCYAGFEHTHSFCKQWFKHGRAYDLQETDIDKLFAGLLRPDKEPTTPPPSPPPGPGPADPGPGGEENGNSGGETSGEKEPQINKILPCRALRHLWQAGIYDLPAYAKIGDAVRSDFFLWFKDFNLLKTTEPLGNRILAVRPVKPFPNANAILFYSFSRSHDKAVYLNKYFVLQMENRTQFNKECNRLFDRVENAAGTTDTVRKHDMVVIAGDWSEIERGDYATFEIDDGPHCFGAQIAHYYSRKQIYPIPTDPFKTK